MKIIRSEGQSFTTVEKESPRKLKRGLRRNRDKLLTPTGYRNRLQIHPFELGSYLEEDYLLVIRQVISALDKVILKPRNLRSCHLQTYVDRTHLATALWARLERHFGSSIRGLENGDEAFVEFRKSWMWKVHPYAEKACNWTHPSADRNSAVIRKLAPNDVSRDAAKGRWHEALWCETDGKPDYESTAEAIWAHLFRQEIKINGRPRNRDRHADVQPGGLIAARGQAISYSTSHPLIPDDVKSETPHRAREERRNDLRAVLKNVDIHDIYFGEEEDIAAQISNEVIKAVDAPTDDRKPAVNAATFGRLLYEHFGKVLKRRSDDEEEKKALWGLHNQVRTFYRTLAKSTRFRLAIHGKAKDVEKLRQLLPADKTALLKVLNAKTQNADISALIRLGKLVAHATDIPGTVDDPQTEFERRLEHYATSEGQNEIKRNEAFARVWRTSVALSLRALQVLAPAKVDPEDHDPAGMPYAQKAVSKRDFKDPTKNLELIFGNKQIGETEPRSRLDAIRIPATDRGPRQLELDKELVWALLRLTGEIRNATNHFNTKRRLVELLETEILEWEEEPNPGGRQPNFAYEGARDAFRRLLDFDLTVRREVILDEFRRLKVHEYVRPSNIDKLFVEFRQAPDMIGLTMPKFMSVLRHALNTARADEVNMPNWLKPFAGLDLSNQSKQTEGPNHFIIGVLRQLYRSGFAGWLAGKQGDAACLQAAVDEVIRFKRQRFDNYQGQEREEGRERYYAMPDIFAETLLIDETTTLDSLISELHSRAMSEEALRHTYRAARGRQSDRTRRVGEFKLDLFAYLFASYLREDRVSWLIEVEEKLPASERAETADLSQYAGEDLKFKFKPWHSLFYVWLYLVPMDDVALLRNQFRKTRALEGKAADAKSDETLIEIDRLMGLYLAVFSAGFSGTEQGAVLNRTATVAKEGQPRQDALSKLLDQDMESSEAMLPGTNRGLRQLAQMGTHMPLTDIFEKHPVTQREIAALAKQLNNREEIAELFKKRNALANEIQELSKKQRPDEEELKRLCEAYQELATKAAVYNFQITGARLRDHARLHQLMMRILGRLLDFTLMWERDKQYAYLGMLYRKLQEGIAADRDLRSEPSSPEHPVTVDIKWADKDRTKLGFILPAELRRRLAELYPHWIGTLKRGLAEGNIQQADIDAGILPIWHSRFGYVLKGDEPEVNLLECDNREMFVAKFVSSTKENPLDQEARERRKADGYRVHEPQQNGTGPSFFTGRAQIRHDFAHFNMLRENRLKDLNYFINSVRSLVAYDRKLKNAVSQSIADILQDVGLTISWTLREDRLKETQIVPVLIPTSIMSGRRNSRRSLAFPKSLYASPRW